MGSGSDDKSADSVEAQVDVQADAGALRAGERLYINSP